MSFKNVTLLCLLLTILVTIIKLMHIPTLIQIITLESGFQYLISFIADNLINVTLLIFFSFLFKKQA